MREDRSWVAPLAFVAFGGILVAAIFTTLWAEDTLLTEKGTALAAWLTFAVTTLALLAAGAAVYFALNQSRAADSRIAQLKLEIFEKKIRKIGEYKDCILTILESCAVISVYIEEKKKIDSRYNENLGKIGREVAKASTMEQIVDEDIIENAKEDIDDFFDLVRKIVNIANDTINLKENRNSAYEIFEKASALHVQIVNEINSQSRQATLNNRPSNTTE